MRSKRKRAADGAGSFTRLDPFTRGMIWGLRLADTPRDEICALVAKKDAVVKASGSEDISAATYVSQGRRL